MDYKSRSCTFAPIRIKKIYKMSKEIKTAIIVLIGIVCFIFGFNFLKSTPIFSNNNEFHAIFEHSGGLQTGTAVTVNGVIVGAVTKIKIDEKTTKIVVTFSCKKDFTFSKNSKVEIFSSLLGNAGLQIVPVMDDAPRAQSGDYLASSIQKGLLDAVSSEFLPTSQNINKTLSSTDGLINNLSQTLNQRTQQDIQQSLASLNSTLQNLNKASASLEKLITSNQKEIDAMLKNSARVSQNFAKISDTLSQAHIGTMVQNLQQTLSKVNALVSGIEKGEGTLGLLMTDTKLYDNLRTASSEMGLLMEDIRRNPKRYIHLSLFGKKNKPYNTPQEVEPSISERAEQLKKQNQDVTQNQ